MTMSPGCLWEAGVYMSAAACGHGGAHVCVYLSTRGFVFSWMHMATGFELAPWITVYSGISQKGRRAQGSPPLGRWQTIYLAARLERPSAIPFSSLFSHPWDQMKVLSMWPQIILHEPCSCLVFCLFLTLYLYLSLDLLLKEYYLTLMNFL